MYNVLIVGKTGEGKSEVVKKLIIGKPCFVFDLRNEYGSKTKYEGQSPINLSDNTDLSRSRHINGNFEEFITQVEGKENTIVVFEEATGFLEGRVAASFKRIITNKMFTNNVYVFIFHSIVDIPPAIMRSCEYAVVFKTLDEEHYIEKKYPRLVPVFKKLKGMKKGECMRLKLN